MLSTFQPEFVIFISTPRLGKILGVLNKRNACIARIMLSRTKEQGGEEAFRWQRVRLRDRLLLLNKAFTGASLKCGASSAFASDPGGVPDIPGPE